MIDQHTNDVGESQATSDMRRLPARGTCFAGYETPARVASGCAAAVMGVGVLALVGWLLRIEPLKWK